MIKKKEENINCVKKKKSLCLEIASSEVDNRICKLWMKKFILNILMTTVKTDLICEIQNCICYLTCLTFILTDLKQIMLTKQSNIVGVKLE